ncbi:MAG: ADP-ribosylglycohydrolase family protein [Anaerolineae bacterium]|nr:ADP-ribosylglycohydrolase family protein [Anaerolineae bacterium]
MTSLLQDKFFGCIAGVHIGSAMAAPVEGWSYQRIEQTYGTLDHLLPYHHYQKTTDWVREPGTTEDGVERQKLIITTIDHKQGRITAEDLRATWVSDMNPHGAGVVSEPFEGPLLAMAKTPIPARDLGRYCDYAGLVSFARSCHPIGLINAGDPETALEDILEVGQVYQTSNSRGLQWAAVTAVAIAEATKRHATVSSVLDTVMNICGSFADRFVQDAGVVRELEKALKLTDKCQDFRQLRKTFDEMYAGYGIPYAHSYANEVVTKAICIFRMVKGDLREAIISGVNMGRDTDCMTAVSAGISGALTGSRGLPDTWVKQVDYATSINPHTNSRRTLQEHADALYNAFQHRLDKLRTYSTEMRY